MNIRDNIYFEIETERAYQNDRWGEEFDDKNTVNDWVTYICHYCTESAMHDPPLEVVREKLLKTATLAVAALEAFDRNGGLAPRHYDT